MNPPCARCSKTVYPVEKLNCLDKYWHKGCFKCETCSLTLSLKTYKGYNKLPYCNVHYPVTHFTAVADTPENRRLKKQTDNLSLINYHKDYNQSVKGTKMSVADDPESLRAKKSQNQLSSLKYHGKDRTNPASTPLNRPAFSSPGYVITHNGEYTEVDDDDKPKSVSSEPEEAPRSASPDVLVSNELEAPAEVLAPPEPVPEPEPEPVLPEAPPAEEAKPNKVKGLAAAFQDPAGMQAPVDSDEEAVVEPPAPEEEAAPPAAEEAPPAPEEEVAAEPPAPVETAPQEENEEATE
ncbi:LIM and SH3 domain protein 1-like isoform X5 [Bolinopsis microptera]|uniref:LIM and SH3 domain protein 1-like isoform X5 n=1 Tax=Bolinopsis microptera TaxID=2820187 RepID=UPI00307A25E4